MIKHPVSVGDTYYLYVTFYGDEFEGKQSADGSTFSNSEMTCAARGFPFGTTLEIQSLETGKSVQVAVTDRPGKNVVDLTKSAFIQIDNPEKGKIRAKIKVVEKAQKKEQLAEKTKEEGTIEQKSPEDRLSETENKTEKSNKFYTIQLIAFSELEWAKKFQETQSVETYIFAVKGSQDVYRVRHGRFSSKEEAEEYKKSHFPDTEAIIVEVTE